MRYTKAISQKNEFLKLVKTKKIEMVKICSFFSGIVGAVKSILNSIDYN